jgi:cobalamin biosynthesis Mg chelatase CobN
MIDVPIICRMEANGRGFWSPSESVLERLEDLYAEVEDQIEGVA